MKKLNTFLNATIGFIVGFFAGDVGYTYYKYRTHPELYEIQSAPWYTGIIASGIFAAILIIICLIIKLSIRKKVR